MNLNLNYISQGHGIPLVFQHGLTANIKQVETLLDNMEEICLLSIDCPGHGSAGLPDDYIPSFDHYSDEVIRFLDQQGIKQAIFGGISMGSGIAVNIVLRYPNRVKALMLVRPAWLDYPYPENLKILLPATEFLNNPGGEERFRQLQQFKDITLPAVAESILGVFSTDQQPGLAKVIRHMVGDRPFSDMEHLRKIKVPCLILANNDDPLHPYEMAEKIHQSIPRSVLTKLTSRYIADDLHRQEVRKAIRDFIQVNKLNL